MQIASSDFRALATVVALMHAPVKFAPFVPTPEQPEDRRLAMLTEAKISLAAHAGALLRRTGAMQRFTPAERTEIVEGELQRLDNVRLQYADRYRARIKHREAREREVLDREIKTARTLEAA